MGTIRRCTLTQKSKITTFKAKLVGFDDLTSTLASQKKARSWLVSDWERLNPTIRCWSVRAVAANHSICNILSSRLPGAENEVPIPVDPKDTAAACFHTSCNKPPPHLLR
jgi:hypothetical protein